MSRIIEVRDRQGGTAGRKKESQEKERGDPTIIESWGFFQGIPERKDSADLLKEKRNDLAGGPREPPQGDQEAVQIDEIGESTQPAKSLEADQGNRHEIPVYPYCQKGEKGDPGQHELAIRLLEKKSRQPQNQKGAIEDDSIRGKGKAEKFRVTASVDQIASALAEREPFGIAIDEGIVDLREVK